MNDESQKDLTTSKPQLPTRLSNTEGLLAKALESLPAEQRESLYKEALGHRLELEVEAARAEQRHENSAEEMLQHIQYVKGLSSTGRDFKSKQHGNTATGGWESESTSEKQKSSYTLVMVIAIAVAVLAIVLLSR